MLITMRCFYVSECIIDEEKVFEWLIYSVIILMNHQKQTIFIFVINTVNKKMSLASRMISWAVASMESSLFED